MYKICGTIGAVHRSTEYVVWHSLSFKKIHYSLHNDKSSVHVSWHHSWDMSDKGHAISTLRIILFLDVPPLRTILDFEISIVMEMNFIDLFSISHCSAFTDNPIYDFRSTMPTGFTVPVVGNLMDTGLHRPLGIHHDRYMRTANHWMAKVSESKQCILESITDSCAVSLYLESTLMTTQNRFTHKKWRTSLSILLFWFWYVDLSKEKKYINI